MNNVSIIAEPGQQWDRIFEEVAQAFADALADTDIKLVFGAHLLDRDDAALDGSVLYQSEQIAAPDSGYGPYRKTWYLDILKQHEVWDYSMANVAALKACGVEAKFVPIRYMPSMTRFRSLPPEQQDIDVLFYGSTNHRRISILNDLIKAGLRVHKLYNVHGAERDAWIARSKVILNIHMSDDGIFEIFRCAHLFANSKCVVSEMGRDTKLDTLYGDCAKIVQSPYGLVLACLELVENQPARSVIEYRALDAFKSPTLKDEIRKVLPNQYPLWVTPPK